MKLVVGFVLRGGQDLAFYGIESVLWQGVDVFSLRVLGVRHLSARLKFDTLTAHAYYQQAFRTSAA
jgi:hypothetical protein